MTNTVPQIASRKIGTNKGKRRIWLEKKILSSNGFAHGDRFDVVNTPNQLQIVRASNGARKVAGKPDRPIIDMTAATITDSFAADIVAVSIVATARGLILTGIKS